MFREPMGKSKRTVTLPAALVELLKVHQSEQAKARLLAGELWEDHDLVFCQSDGHALDPRRDWAEWMDILGKAGVRDIRVHGGRHTAATLLMEQGIHVRVVQEILGHSDMRVTQRYTHVASATARDAAAGRERCYSARRQGQLQLASLV